MIIMIRDIKSPTSTTTRHKVYSFLNDLYRVYTVNEPRENYFTKMDTTPYSTDTNSHY